MQKMKVMSTYSHLELKILRVVQAVLLKEKTLHFSKIRVIMLMFLRRKVLVLMDPYILMPSLKMCLMLKGLAPKLTAVKLNKRKTVSKTSSKRKTNS
jgi:hypothetical protein